jgi:hypothetical protein
MCCLEILGVTLQFGFLLWLASCGALWVIRWVNFDERSRRERMLWVGLWASGAGILLMNVVVLIRRLMPK